MHIAPGRKRFMPQNPGGILQDACVSYAFFLHFLLIGSRFGAIIKAVPDR